MEQFDNIYRGKTVLVTGHTGFKGSWLSIWLVKLGAKVVGYGLDPYTEKDNFVLSDLKNKIIDIRGDIRDYKKLNQIFEEYKPEFVFHLAAQPLVRESYINPVYTYEVNVMGTINVLECIRNSLNEMIGIFITTDKCYENKEQVWGYKENDKLGGYDPYSSSKAACEIAINSWRKSYMNPNKYNEHKKAIASARAGNVIGGGDWSKDRIIPDCIRAAEANTYVEIRSPKSIRPWQHVLEALGGYLTLGRRLVENPIDYSEEWNFGPYIKDIVSVKEMCKILKGYYNNVEYKVNENNNVHEANLLALEINKAIFKLGWKPVFDIEEALLLTAEWYINYKNENVFELCSKQIDIISERL